MKIDDVAATIALSPRSTIVIPARYDPSSKARGPHDSLPASRHRDGTHIQPPSHSSQILSQRINAKISVPPKNRIDSRLPHAKDLGQLSLRHSRLIETTMQQGKNIITSLCSQQGRFPALAIFKSLQHVHISPPYRIA
ncbi:MAG: hypothetical protein MSA63_08815 [Actinomyces urogenitalis]|nr:hypothetical protein [Actinomyces urogenitalis]MCI7457520.1 hypothetical protein [Actinomyces urogenitalis]